MCRNIKKLRFADRPPTEEELSLAARQFVRKISGYREPSRINQAVYEQAIQDIADASQRMFEGLATR